MAFLAFLNTFLCYTSPTYTHNSYPLAIRHTNPLLNRIFGTWTLMSGAVRLYVAPVALNEQCQTQVVLNKSSTRQQKDPRSPHVEPFVADDPSSLRTMSL